METGGGRSSGCLEGTVRDPLGENLPQTAKSAKSACWGVNLRATLWLTGSLLFVQAWWMVGGWGGGVVSLGVADAISTILPLVAGILCLDRSFRETKRTAAAWLLLGWGCVAWGVGNAVWSFDELVVQADVPLAERSIPFPSLADAGYLLFLVLAAPGLALLPSRLWHDGARLRILFDALLLAGTLAFIGWGALLGPLLEDAGTQRTLASVLAFTYPMGDVVLLALALLAGAYSAPHERRGRSLLIAGLAILAVADVVFWLQDANGTYQSGGFLDLVWPLGFALLAVAASSGRLQAAQLNLPGDPQGVLMRFLPIVPVGLALLTAAMLQLGQALTWDALGILAIVVALAVGREVAWRYERGHWTDEAFDGPAARGSQ